MKIKILLIGGSGFLGAWVSRVLQKYLFQIRIMDLVKPNLEWHRLSGMQQAEWIQGDISKKSDVENALKCCDAIIFASPLNDSSRTASFCFSLRWPLS